MNLVEALLLVSTVFNLLLLLGLFLYNLDRVAFLDSMVGWNKKYDKLEMSRATLQAQVKYWKDYSEKLEKDYKIATGGMVPKLLESEKEALRRLVE